MKQMMLIAIGLIACVIDPSIGPSGYLEAQQPAAAHRVASREASTLQRDAWRVLDRQVSVQFERVPVKDALAKLATEANISIQYQADVFNGVQRSVTMQATNAEFGGVIETILEGTGLQAIPFANDGVTIVRRPGSVAVVQGTIVGKVTDAKTGKPVQGATVTIDDGGVRVTTGSDGMFRIAASAGEHTVGIRAVGFVRQTKIVTVTGDKTITLDVQLAASASVLDEVVVTGTVVETERKAIPTPITVITAEEIERRGITRIEQFFRGEVPGLLALEQGTMVYGTNLKPENLGAMVTSQVYSRGSSSIDGAANPVKTYIDGVELLDPSYLGTIDPKSIDRIEIITGPQAATIYGSGALGGVMQIFTKKGGGRNTPDVTVNLKYGILENNISTGQTPSHDHSVLLNGGTGPAFSYSGSLSYNYVGQWQPGLYSRSYGASIGATHTTGWATVSGSVLTTNGSNGMIQGDGQGSLYEQAMVKSGEWDFGFSSKIVVPSQKASSFNQTASLNVDLRPWSFWQHHMTVGRTITRFDMDSDQPQYGWSNDTLLVFNNANGQRTSLSYNTTVMSPALATVSSVLTLGATGSWGDQTRFSGCAISSNAADYSACGWQNTITLGRTKNEKNWGGFGSLRIGIWESLYFTVGLRGESSPSYGRNVRVNWTPTNGIAYTRSVGDLTVKLLGSYGRATRSPTSAMRLGVMATSSNYDPANVYSQLPSMDLEPEIERGPQGGIEVYYGNVASVTINRYHQTVENLILNTVVDSIDRVYLRDGSIYTMPQRQYINIAEVTKHGWETTASFNYRALSLRGTYSWNDSRITRANSQWEYMIGSTFLNLPTHSSHLAATYAIGPTSVNVSINWVGAALYSGSSHPISLERSRSRLWMYVQRGVRNSTNFGRSGYAKADIALAHRISRIVSATVNVTNLGNSYGSEVSMMYPTLGRKTLVGLSLRYP